MAQQAVRKRILEMRAQEEAPPPEPSVTDDAELAHRVKWQLRSKRCDSIEKKVAKLVFTRDKVTNVSRKNGGSGKFKGNILLREKLSPLVMMGVKTLCRNSWKQN